MAVQAQSPQDLENERKGKKSDPEQEAKQKEADSVNASRSGVGTRVMVGRTRGKGSLVVSWEAFDESQPATLPTEIQQFIDLMPKDKQDKDSLVKFLISGFNAESETAASDPLSEFVEPTWPDVAQTQFRLVVRNYARGANVSLEDAVKLIKPGFTTQFSAPAAV